MDESKLNWMGYGKGHGLNIWQKNAKMALIGVGENNLVIDPDDNNKDVFMYPWKVKETLHTNISL